MSEIRMIPLGGLLHALRLEGECKNTRPPLYPGRMRRLQICAGATARQVCGLFRASQLLLQPINNLRLGLHVRQRSAGVPRCLSPPRPGAPCTAPPHSLVWVTGRYGSLVSGGLGDQRGREISSLASVLMCMNTHQGISGPTLA